MEKFTYNHLNTFLKQKFGERVLKISVNAGFTCPNRDGKCGTGGCIFCGETGGSIQRENIPIKTQVETHLNSYKGDRANKFIVYFQNFTNTYASIDVLKQKYDEALSVSDKIVGLAVATRPDCIDEDVAKLLSNYSQKYYVWVELGLQTSNDFTAKIINRGYYKQTFENAVKILNKYNIDIVTHIMVGLPNENIVDVLNTVNYLNKFKLMGVKIHSTYIVRGTKLEQMLINKEYTPLSLEEYINSVIEIITHLNPNFIVHRISGDAPKEKLISPSWNIHKKIVLNGVENTMKRQNLFQGMYLDKDMSFLS